MTPIPFYKWDATGNDFVIVDLATSPLSQHEYSADIVRAMCDREQGVGADGVVLFQRAQKEDEPSRVIILNSDGSSGQMCGNALRCIGLAFGGDEMRALAGGVVIGERTVRFASRGQDSCSVLMGNPGDVAPRYPAFASIESLDMVLGAKGYLLSFGNPHYVVPLQDIPSDWIERGERAQQVADEVLATGGINCGFLASTLSDSGSYRLRVFERGAGVTKSCGSGACAASAVLEKCLEINPPHHLELLGGTLTISRLEGEYLMAGSAVMEFEGQWSLD